MRLGVFQFASTGSVVDNRDALLRGLGAARRQGVELLLTQECGLTGYPPLEVAAVGLDFASASAAWDGLQAEVDASGVAVVVGAATRDASGTHNECRALFPGGRSPVVYRKRALWGWDRDHFRPGAPGGVFDLGGFRFGMRICFEVRFPEYFRELFDQGVDVALVAFKDTSPHPNPGRRALLRAHLQTRAVENAVFVASANGLGDFQTCPTAVVDPDGEVVAEAPEDRESLVVFDLIRDEVPFGRRGRIEVSQRLRGLAAQEEDHALSPEL